MSQRLTTAVDELRAEETGLQADVEELRRQIKTRETQLKQIQKALSLLDQKPNSKLKKSKPAATRQEVIAAMTEVLSATGPVEQVELKRLVTDKLASVGKSRMGLALRFTEALKDGRFVHAEGGLINNNAEPATVSR